MINTFKSQLNDINSGISRPKNINLTTVNKLGVLGSGLMGHGITYVSALSGIEVVMTDSNQENAEKGFSRIKNIFIVLLKKDNYRKKMRKMFLIK